MEKKQPIEHVRMVSSSDNGELEQQDNSKPQIQDPNWNPGFWVRFPWIGFSALVVILFCCAASVVVLEVCNGQSVHQWPQKITPNVLLSIMNGVANICFAIAIGNGIAIAWWRKALKGSSIHELHRTWAFGSSIKEVVFSLKYFNAVALAALTAKLTLIDSTLMQKALTFYSEIDTTPIPISNIRGFASTEWPNTGTVLDKKGTPQYMQEWTLQTYQLWKRSAGNYPTQTWHGCENAFCYFNVPGFGFAFDCGAQTEDYLDIVQSLKNAPTGQNTELMFDISFTTVLLDETPYDSAHIHLNVTWTQQGTYNQVDTWGGDRCQPKRLSQPCRLMPHVIEYPAMVDHVSDTRTISVGPRQLSKWGKLGDKSTLGSNPDMKLLDWRTKQQNGFFVKDPIIINETQTFTIDNPRSKLAGIQLMLQAALGGHATASLTSDSFNPVKINETGSAPTYRGWYPSPWQWQSGSCAPSYYGPFDAYYIGKSRQNAMTFQPDIAASINQIMFGLAIDALQDDKSIEAGNPRQHFTGNRYPYAVHYRAHFAYMWGAVAATICCVLLVLPVYWGFWQLGRKVTLNPFEIAHAFRSPVVEKASTAATADMMKEVGHQEVRYGPVTLDGQAYGRFGVAAPSDVAAVHEAGLRESLRQVSSAPDEHGNSRRMSAVPESFRRLSMVPERNRRMSTLPERSRKMSTLPEQ